MKPLALALLFFAVSAHAGQYWFKDRVAVGKVSVVYSDAVECAGYDDALGCFSAVGDVGVITIRAGLVPYVEKCVLAHERHHAAGYDHVSGRQSYIDCGDGNWLSSETLVKMGVL